MNRIISLFLIGKLVLASCADNDSVIRDYFSYRKVQRVVGFSCGNIESDFNLAKMFTDMYTYVSMYNSKYTVGPGINVKKMLTADYHQLGIFLDSRCNNANYTKVLSDATKYSMYGEMHKWFILSTNLSNSLRLLNDEAFSVMTDIIIAVMSSNDYILYDVYNPCKDRGGSTNITVFGTWSNNIGLIVHLNQSKFLRRSNLHGMKLKVGIAVSYKPENISLHNMMVEYSMKAKYGRSKFLYTLLLHIADLFNFTIDIVQLNTQRRFDTSGPVFAAFQKKLIDLSASPVTMKVDRLSYGDIIGPVWPIRSCFMFRTISSTKMRTAQFLKPLSVKVWYTIFILMAIATSVLVLLLRLEGIQSSSEGYGISVIMTIGALSQQGSSFVPSHYAGRIAFLQILFFSSLISNYYSASVVSDRLKNIGEKMNDSLISLTESNLKIAVEPTPYIRSFLQVADREVKYFYQNRWIKMPENSRYLPLEEGLDRVQEGTLAFHTMIDSAYPYIEHSFNDRSICELTEVHLFRAVLAFYARHKSPFTELMKIGWRRLRGDIKICSSYILLLDIQSSTTGVNSIVASKKPLSGYKESPLGLMKIHNVGIQKRQLKRWSARKPFCPTNLLIAEPLSIYEAAPILIFLCLCTTLAIVTCVIENIIYWIWPTRLSSSLIEKRHLISKNINLRSLKDINLQNLKNLNIFKSWMNLPSP